MRLVLSLVILLGACAGHADDDDDEPEIEINEIDGSAQRARSAVLAEIFESAVQAYLEEDWDGCVAGFHDALHGYVAVDYSAAAINSIRHRLSNLYFDDFFSSIERVFPESPSLSQGEFLLGTFKILLTFIHNLYKFRRKIIREPLMYILRGAMRYF